MPEQTLSPEEQISMGPKMSEEKNEARNEQESETSGGGEAANEKGRQMPWMQRINIARRVREKAREKVKEKVEIPAKIASGRAWQWAWWLLIPSWGLSLIILDILWFGSLITNLICKPGEEWVPKRVLAAGGDAGKLAGKAIGIVERMGLGLLNAIAFFIVMAAVVIIVYFSQNIIFKAGAWVWNLVD